MIYDLCFIFLKLIEQLKPGGRLLIPVGPITGNQWLEQYDKLEDGTIKNERIMAVIFLPLTDKDDQIPPSKSYFVSNLLSFLIYCLDVMFIEKYKSKSSTLFSTWKQKLLIRLLNKSAILLKILMGIK